MKCVFRRLQMYKNLKLVIYVNFFGKRVKVGFYPGGSGQPHRKDFMFVQLRVCFPENTGNEIIFIYY